MEILKSQYKSLSEWRKVDNKSYLIAKRNPDIFDIVCKTYGWGKYAWYVKYNNLLNHVTKFGKIPTDDNTKIFIKIQKKLYNLNKLSNDKIQLLENIIGWNWEQIRKKTICKKANSNLKIGYNNYIKKGGGKVGRKLNFKKPIEKYTSEYKDVIILIKQNIPYRVISNITNKSVTTISKIKKILLNDGYVFDTKTNQKIEYGIENGKVGRPTNYKKTIYQYISENKDIIKYLKKNMSIRKISNICDKSPNTVVKIKKYLNDGNITI